MLPKLSLLEEVRKGGFEASLITTFNAYLPFYEEVVLRHLVNAGVRHNVLLMDGHQYGISLRNHPPRLAGRQYTLMPISVAGAFHPKLIFLVGKQKGLVVVGSHNLTLAGFGFNRELTNLVRIQGSSDELGLAMAAQVWREVESWIKTTSQRVPAQVQDMAQRVREFAPWFKAEALDVEDDVKVLGGRLGAISLWAQLLELIKGRTTDVFVAGAFFDSKLSFLRRIQADLRPERLFVAIDPKTVQMPSRQKAISGVRFVRADDLGVDDKKEDQGSRYLHAKGLFVRTAEGDSVFVSGSANPSAPAWLAEDMTGNAELMLVRLGRSAEITAKEIGFSLISEMPALENSDWTMISENRQEDRDDVLSRQRAGIAIVDHGQILVDADLVSDYQRANLVLIGQDGKEMARTRGFKTENGLCAVAFAPHQLAAAVILRCVGDAGQGAEFLLHHARMVEEQSRTGVQRRFKEALLSLETESPNIGLLIECIDKIVFADSSNRESGMPTSNSTGEQNSADEDDATQSLAVDVSDTKKEKRKKRLTHTGDFAYLLDALIYHLRLQEDKSVEDLDQYGRSEEEQIGADDDEGTETQQLTEQRRVELLEFCHSKVRKVVSRMIALLRAYTAQKQSLNDVLIRLLGVLAVLRELCGCDGRVRWVDKGKTTVPHEDRFRLLDEVMVSLFEGKASLLHLSPLGEEFEHSDDVARLKGLLIWLAWDCGLVLDLQKPFMESTEQLEARLRRNAIMLALAQAVAGDDVVADEARQSIGSLSSSEMDWLKDLQALIKECDAIKRGDSEFHLPGETEPGDIAVHRNMKNWDLRVVAKNSGQYVSLVKLSKDKSMVSYAPEYLVMTRLRHPVRPGQGAGESE